MSGDRLKERRRVLLGVFAPSATGAGICLILAYRLLANNHSSGHEAGAVYGQLFFLFLEVGVLFAIAGVATTASGLLVYLCRRSKHAPWLGWIPWGLVAAFFLLAG